MNSPLTTNQSTGPLSPRVEQLLAQMRPTAPARLIFAADATESRQPTWDMNARLTGEMFGAAAGLGALAIQLVYYGGWDGRCVASNWISNPYALAEIMSGVMCKAGETQIRKVLRHAREVHQQQKISALVFIGDAFEEMPADVYVEARELKVPVFLFQEGNDPHVARIFAEIARISGGARGEFNAGAAQRLAELLRAVVAFATGGLKALAAQKTAAATLLLTQMKN